jgi:hypothetical protein
MSLDRLALAAGALRDVSPATSADAAATRARILAAAAPRRRRRRVAVRLLLSLAATLVLSAAWAGTHRLLGSVWRNAVHFVAPGRDAPRPSPTHAPASLPDVAPPPTPASTVPASTAPPVPVVSVDALPRASVSGAPSAPHAAVVLPATTSASPADVPEAGEADRDLVLYAAAHRAHFVDHDPAAALRAWDAYLAAEPSGRFAPEAHYNRAIALLRLSRRAEARDALAPFASGAYGDYRREDARRLLEALGR